MNEYEGRLRQLGSWKNDGQYVRYTQILIGDQVLKDVRVPVVLDGPLRRELATRGTIKIAVSYRPFGMLLQAVTTTDGRIFRRSSRTAVVATVISLSLGLTLIGIGIEATESNFRRYATLALGLGVLAFGLYGLFFIKKIRAVRAYLIV